jgi:hypothetical protein
MKNIETILDELRNHPDFLTAEIFLKSDVVDNIIETIEDEEGDELYRPSVEKWVKQNSHMVIKNINAVVCDGYEYMSPFENTIQAFRKEFLVESK